jgi:uncharacterized protein (TIGR03118 family)
MSMHSKAAAWCKAGLLGLSLGAIVASCGGGGGSDMSMAPPMGMGPPPVTITSLVNTNLVSDGPGAAHMDPNLINAWGLAFNPAGFAWVANNGSSTATLYDGNGVPQTLVVAIPPGSTGPANPTGIVYNGSSDFKLTQNGVSGASLFIFAGEGGTVAGWSPALNSTNAVTAVDTGPDGALYKGLAIASFAGANFLYAADFRHGAVDVYDASFRKVSLPGGGFVDPTLPAGYAPFGIQAIGGKIYVSYAQRAGTGPDELDGPGLGFVDVFDAGGALVRRLISGGALNAPWGMAMAPANFGSFSNMLLVANFGDGKINAFDPATGAMAGTLTNAGGAPFVIDKLWGIAFGNGINNEPANTLFYTAGPGDEAHGAYGRIDVR